MKGMNPDAFWATPHARGSTVYIVHTDDIYTGYPACAGIDLYDSEQDSRRYWLPRMRGDRPFLWCKWCL